MAIEKNIKSTLKHTYHRVDNKIVNTLSYFGRTDKRPVARHPPILQHSDDDYNKLINKAQRYDLDQFFVLEERTLKHELSLGYRVTLGIYQILRDTGVGSVKAIYRLVQGR